MLHSTDGNVGSEKKLLYFLKTAPLPYILVQPKATNGFAILILLSSAFAGPFTSVNYWKLRVETQSESIVYILAIPVFFPRSYRGIPAAAGWVRYGCSLRGYGGTGLHTFLTCVTYLVWVFMTDVLTMFFLSYVFQS